MRMCKLWIVYVCLPGDEVAGGFLPMLLIDGMACIPGSFVSRFFVLLLVGWLECIGIGFLWFRLRVVERCTFFVSTPVFYPVFFWLSGLF
jgi:hypothetical protein